MKRYLYVVLLLLLATPAVAAEIAVQVHLCELRGETKLPEDILNVLKQKGADPITFPKLITRSGKAVEASVTREFKIANKGTFQTGIVLSIRPTFYGERFRYSADFDYTEFEGFAPRSATKAPILTTKKILGIDGVCSSGEVIWLDLGGREDQQMVSERGKRDRVRTFHRRLIAILSFNKV